MRTQEYARAAPRNRPDFRWRGVQELGSVWANVLSQREPGLLLLSVGLAMIAVVVPRGVR